MASGVEFVDYVCEQLANAGEITYRRMFGSYGIYMDGKFIALICDDQFFLKPTAVGKQILVAPTEEPPFHGAKDWYIIEDFDDRDFLAHLLTATWEALPFPKPKKK